MWIDDLYSSIGNLQKIYAYNIRTDYQSLINSMSSINCAYVFDSLRDSQLKLNRGLFLNAISSLSQDGQYRDDTSFINSTRAYWIRILNLYVYSISSSFYSESDELALIQVKKFKSNVEYLVDFFITSGIYREVSGNSYYKMWHDMYRVVQDQDWGDIDIIREKLGDLCLSCASRELDPYSDFKPIPKTLLGQDGKGIIDYIDLFTLLFYSSTFAKNFDTIQNNIQTVDPLEELFWSTQWSTTNPITDRQLLEYMQKILCTLVRQYCTTQITSTFNIHLANIKAQEISVSQKRPLSSLQESYQYLTNIVVDNLTSKLNTYLDSICYLPTHVTDYASFKNWFTSKLDFTGVLVISDSEIQEIITNEYLPGRVLMYLNPEIPPEAFQNELLKFLDGDENMEGIIVSHFYVPHNYIQSISPLRQSVGEDGTYGPDRKFNTLDDSQPLSVAVNVDLTTTDPAPFTDINFIVKNLYNSLKYFKGTEVELIEFIKNVLHMGCWNSDIDLDNIVSLILNFLTTEDNDLAKPLFVSLPHYKNPIYTLTWIADYSTYITEILNKLPMQIKEGTYVFNQLNIYWTLLTTTRSDQSQWITNVCENYIYNMTASLAQPLKETAKELSLLLDDTQFTATRIVNTFDDSYTYRLSRSDKNLLITATNMMLRGEINTIEEIVSVVGSGLAPIMETLYTTIQSEIENRFGLLGKIERNLYEVFESSIVNYINSNKDQWILTLKSSLDSSYDSLSSLRQGINNTIDKTDLAPYKAYKKYMESCIYTIYNKLKDYITYTISDVLNPQNIFIQTSSYLNITTLDKTTLNNIKIIVSNLTSKFDQELSSFHQTFLLPASGLEKYQTQLQDLSNFYIENSIPYKNLVGRIDPLSLSTSILRLTSSYFKQAVIPYHDNIGLPSEFLDVLMSDFAHDFNLILSNIRYNETRLFSLYTTQTLLMSSLASDFKSVSGYILSPNVFLNKVPAYGTSIYLTKVRRSKLRGHIQKVNQGYQFQVKDDLSLESTTLYLSMFKSAIDPLGGALSGYGDMTDTLDNNTLMYTLLNGYLSRPDTYILDDISRFTLPVLIHNNLLYLSVNGQLINVVYPELTRNL